MLFWLIAALLTMSASLAVLLPLTRRGDGQSVEADHDIEVYRDQLAEIDRDLARGLIAPAEAGEARAEIGRRIIQADKAAGTPGGHVSSRSGRLVAAVAVLAVPLVSWSVYAAIGSPDTPSQPLSARLSKSPADSSLEELLARAEAHLAANPSDARGWEVLAPIYMRVGRFGESVTAYRNAIRLEGATAARQTGLGEALSAAAGGLVTAEAKAAFQAALALEPGDPKASYYLATALAQEGRAGEALAAWHDMLPALPADSPWRQATEDAIMAARARMVEAGTNAAGGPSQSDVEAAAGMSGPERAAMIEQMVAGLDERLRQNPHDPEGWTRLVRSYLVLGKVDAARDAVARGKAALGQGSDAARQFALFADGLGLPATE